jgi:hypothetical protein
MNNEPTIPTMTEIVTTPCDRRTFSSLCWSAIIGGTVAAIGIQILLSILGTGAGLAIFAPMTDNNPVKGFSEGAAAIWSICALIALFFGAAIAGRFSHSVHGGFVHGILVWCLTLIISLVLLTAGTSMVMGGLLKVLGEGLGIGGKAVAAGAGDLAKDGVKRSSDQLGSFIDEAVQSVPTNAAPKAAVRAKREIGFAVTKLFAPGNDIASSGNRTAAIKSLADYAQMTEADATKTVDDWIASYKNLKAELDSLKVMAEQKAKVVADEAAHDLSITAMWAFSGLLLGLLVSAAGGILGAENATRRVKIENVRLTQLSAK